MKSTTVLTALLSTSLSLATPISPHKYVQADAIYSVKSFTTQKLDDTTISAVSFHILATDGTPLDIACSAYDPATGEATTSFENGKIYPCGENSLYSFRYTPGAAETVDDLFIWQDVGGAETWMGSTTPLDGVCTAGEDVNEVANSVCVSPDIGYTYIELRELQDCTQGVEGCLLMSMSGQLD